MMISDMNKLSVARWGFKLALTGAVLLVVAVIGHRLGVMDFRIALFGLVGGAALGMLAAFLGVIGMIVARKEKVSGKSSAWVGLIFGLLVASPVLLTINAASNVPPIHDITTDLKNPPEFVAMLVVRSTSDNPLDRKNPTDLATSQQAAYPGLVPVLINQDVNQVFDQVHALVTARGWEIVAASAQQGRIEATATTPIMGFKDDVVIRVRDESDGTMVDMRSVSRVGKSDLGANAKRIEAFMADLRGL